MHANTRGVLAVLVALGAGWLLMSGTVQGADLPKATQKTLKKLNLDASILEGIDEELKVPQKWIDGAKKEGAVTIYATLSTKRFNRLIGPFKERYPFIKVNYTRARTSARRIIRPLVAFKQGRYVADVIAGLSGNTFLFKEADAFEDLRDLPNFDKVPAGLNHPDGIAVSVRLRYWCLSYNTNLVKESELPKTWDELVTNPRWQGKKILLGNRPNNWLLNLWGANGEAWAKGFMDKLFKDTKPQLRKEGMSALLALVVAGEGHLGLPSAMNRVGPKVKRGEPVGHHCPEPVPFVVSEMGVMKGNPHINASKIYVNWYLSKEGQVSQFYGNDSTPIHKDLFRKEFIFFPEKVIGKKMAKTSAEAGKDAKVLLTYWNKHWLGAGGPSKKEGGKFSTVKVTLKSIKRGGRILGFSVKGQDHTTRVSGSRTEVRLNGKEDDRGNLKVGMTCEITYPGNGKEAKKVSCR